MRLQASRERRSIRRCHRPMRLNVMQTAHAAGVMNRHAVTALAPSRSADTVVVSTQHQQ